MKKPMHNSLMHKCVYCYEWTHSAIAKRSMDRSHSKLSVSRQCTLTKKIIDTNSDGCKYFNPALNFHCNKNHWFIAFLACLNRRHNQKELNSFEQCKKCRQFDGEIKPIIKDYWVEGKQIVKPKRTIKRRDKVSRKRTIKRRDRKIKRAIKRRR